MSSSNKERFYVGKSRRSSPGDSHSSGHHGGFFPTGQGGRPVLPPLSDSFPTLRFPVPAAYPTSYTQPRSAPNRLSYDLDPQAIYGAYPNTSTSPQFPSAFPNYEIHHDRYSPQPSYPTYPARSSPPIVTNPAERRLPPLSTSPPPGERWQQQTCLPLTGFPATNIRSPTATYPAHNQFMHPYPSASYHYPMPHPEHVGLGPQPPLFDEIPRPEPRSASPFRVQGPAGPPPTPPPISPTSPEETAVKKKRRRADANQLKVLNETYARTAFPSTEERIALAKMLDMSARSVQIWFQNKRQAMRQTNRQANSLASHSQHPYTVASQLTEELVAHPPPGYELSNSVYLTSSPENSRHTHTQYSGYGSRHRD